MTDEQNAATKPEGDVWKQWLLHRRNPTDDSRARNEEHFRQVRDKVLDNSGVEEGDTLLDVGTGTGLVSFGALERVGPTGSVIFSDISQDCLDHCHSLAEELGMLDRSRFLRASMESLSEVGDASVDVVTTRSVIIYTTLKQQAFQEFYRVLKPGGRLSMFEPINSFSIGKSEGKFRGYDVPEIRDLCDRVQQVLIEHQPLQGSPLLDFDERDLIRFADDAGFTYVKLEMEATVARGIQGDWDMFYHSAPNPLALSLQEAAERALTSEERDRFVSVLKKAVQTQQLRFQQAIAYLVAVKPISK
jgi:SAM-dependent methyltransferase